MSTQIDERVVSMKFDARDFDKNVQSTMTLLDKFKDQLNFKGAQKGLQDISDASSKVRLTGLENAAVAVEAKFSAMSIAAISAINHIVTTAMSAGTQIVKSLTVDQITSGFTKYESKLTSVQTIMNATGLSIDEVSAQLDKLIWFTDETSYSFTDMVNNVGKFTSNQIDLGVAVKSMMGIANAAGLAGASVENASHAMEGFSKAMGKGYMENQNWQWIQTAKMDTAAFKQLLLDAAVSVGTLKKVGDGLYKTLKGNEVSISDFQSAMKDAWMTNDVMLAGLGEFGDYAEQVFELCEKEGILASEAMDRLAGSASEMGEKAFRASQEAKTFTDAINATKDAVSSKWMQTFEIIFGNYEEATELWTNLTEVLWDIFAASGDVRNEMLKSWVELGGRTELLESIADIYESILSIVEPLKEAIADMFPEVTPQTLINITNGIKEFAEAIRLTDEQAYGLKAVFEVLLVPIYAVYKAIVTVASISFYFVIAIAEMVKAMLTLIATTNPVEDFFRNLFGDERYERVMVAMAKIINNIADAFNRVRELISNVIKQIRESEKLNEIFQKLAEILEPIKESLLDAIVVGLEALADVNFDNVEKFATTTLNAIVQKLETIAPTLGSILDFINKIGTTVKDYFTGVNDLAAPIENVETLQTSFKGLNTTVTNFKDAFNLDSVLAGTGALTEKLGFVVEGLTNSLGGLIGRLEPAKVLLFAFGTGLTSAMFGLTKALNAFTGVGASTKLVLDNTASAIKNFGDSFKPSKVMNAAKAIAVLAAAVLVLSLVDPASLAQATLAVAELAAVLGGFMVVMGLIEKFLLKGDDMSKVTTAALKIGVALTALSASLVILSHMDVDGIEIKIVALIAIMTAMGTVVAAMSYLSKNDISKNAGVIIAFSIALFLMVTSLKQLANFDISSLVSSIGSLIVLMGLLAILSRAIGEIKFSKSLGVTLMIANLFILVFALQALIKVPLETIKAAIPVFIAIVGMLSLLMLSTKAAGENAQKAGIYIIALSVSMLILGEAIRVIGSFDTGVAVQGTIVVGILIGLFTVLTAFTKNISKDVASMSKVFITLSISILLLSVCISYLGALDLAQAVQGATVVSVLLIVLSLIMKMNSTVIKEGEKFKSGATAMIAMAFLLGVTAAALAILTLLPDQDRVLQSAVALTTVILAMGAAAVAMSVLAKSLEDIKLTKLAGYLAEMLLAIWAMSAILKSVQEMNPETAIATAAGLSLMLIAMGVSAKLLSGFEADASGVAGSIVTLMTLVVAVNFLSQILASINELDPVNSLAGALSLSLLLVALGAATGLLSGFKASEKGVIDAIAVMGGLTAALVVISLILVWIKDMDPAGSIVHAVALSALLVALAFSAKLLSGFEKTDLVSAGGVLVELSLCMFLLAAVLKIIVDMKCEANITNVIALGIMLVAVAAAARLMQGLQNIDLGAALQAILAVGVAILALAAVVSLIDLVVKQFDQSKSAVDVFGMIGASIGEMIGQFVGHIGEAMSESFPIICQNMVDGINAFDDVKDNVVTGASNLALAILAITGAEMISNLTNLIPFIGAGGSLGQFGDQLKELGPAIAEFAESTKDVKVVQLTAAANSVKLLAEAYGGIQKSIGDAIGGALTGTGTFTSFVEDFKDLGPALKDFADTAADLDIEAMKKGVSAAEAIADLENSLSKHGGIAQDVFGDANLETFADNIVRFAYAMWHYSDIITQGSGLDVPAMEEAVGAGAALADLESSLRGHGGIWSIFGDADIGQFGDHIAQFGAGLAAYSAALQGKGNYIKGGGGSPVDVQAIVDSVPAGQALADLEKNLAPSGGTWQSIFGGQQDLGNFANNIAAFGEGLSSYYTSIKSITDWEQITNSATAGKALSDLESGLTATGGWDFWSAKADFKEFGSNLESLGKALEKYSTSLSKVDISGITEATTSLEGLVALSKDMEGSPGLNQLAAQITNLANSGIKDFVSEFENSDQQLVDAINSALSKAIATLESQKLGNVGSDMVAGILDGIIQNESKLQKEAEGFADLVSKGVNAKQQIYKAKGGFIVQAMINGMNEKQSKITEAITTLLTTSINNTKSDAAIYRSAQEIGSNVVKGISQGISSQQSSLNKTVTNMSQSMIDTSKKVLDEHSPSVEFNTIGMNAVKGLQGGLEENSKSLNKTASKVMTGLLDEVIDDFKIDKTGSQVMKDKVGVYLIKGIAEGITTDMSAEEAAAKKAENIVNSFKNAIEAASSKADLSNSQYNIWNNMYGKDASAEEARLMQNLNYASKLSAKGQEVAYNQAALKALEMKGFGAGTSQYDAQFLTTTKSEEEYSALIREYLDTFEENNPVQERMDELNKIIDDAKREAQKAEDDYNIWFNQHGKTASVDELKRKQEQMYEKQMSAMGTIYSARETLKNITLKAFGEDSEEYMDACDNLTDDLQNYQKSIGTYIDVASPDSLIITKLDKEINDVANSVKLAEQAYTIWENQYGEKASDEEKRAKEQELLEKKLEAAGTTLSNNEAKLAIIMDQYGEDSEEYIAAQEEMNEALIAYQKLINEYRALMNPVKDSTVSTREAWQTASQKYSEMMNKDYVENMMKNGFTKEQIEEWAKEQSGLKALEDAMNGIGQLSYDDVYDKFKSPVDILAERASMSNNLNYEDLFPMYKTAFEEGIDWESKSSTGLTAKEVWDMFIPSDIEVQIDANGEIIKDLTKTTTQKAAASGSRAGTSSGLSSGVSSGMSDFAASVSSGTDVDINSAMESVNSALNRQAQALGLGNINVRAAFDSEGSLADIGMNWAQGLINGMDEKADDIVASAKARASEMLGGFCDFLGINSPSTVMTEQGYWVDLGLANGIEDNAYLIIDSVKAMVDGMLDVTTNTSEQIRAIGRSIVTGIIEGFNQTSYKIYTRISEALTKTADLVTHYDTQTYYTVGDMLVDSMINGMLEGIANREAQAINAVVQLATEMYQAACGALGIGVGMEVVAGAMSGVGGGGGTTTYWDPSSGVLGPNAGLFTKEEHDLLDKLEQDVIHGRISNEEYNKRWKEIVGDREIKIYVDTTQTEKQVETIAATYSTEMASKLSEVMTTSGQSGSGLQNGSNGLTGTTYNFYQTNNSPTALSRIDVYRDTKNLLSAAKGVT